MKEDVRQSSGSTTSNGTTVLSTTGTGTVGTAELICGCPQPGPETIQVEQVLGADMQQKVLEMDMTVPSVKPDIEQVIDVYVKDVEINTVDVIPNKVIIRGELEVKVMYVADLPNQPVHAFEQKHIRFTRDIPIEGVMKDMDATADVTVEFVDYDFDPDDPRTVHITIVLKFWARVVTTTEMEVIALSPVDEIGQVEYSTAAMSSDDTASASTLGGAVSASQTGGGDIAAVSPQNVFVTGPGITPTAGMNMGISGTVTISGTNVNIRTGPGTNFPVITKLNTGAVLIVKEQAFGWYKVVLPDGNTTGWVASWLVAGGTAGAMG